MQYIGIYPPFADSRPAIATYKTRIFSKPYISPLDRSTNHLPICPLLGGESIHHTWPKTIESTDGLFRPAWWTFPLNVHQVEKKQSKSITLNLQLHQGGGGRRPRRQRSMGNSHTISEQVQILPIAHIFRCASISCFQVVSQ